MAAQFTKKDLSQLMNALARSVEARGEKMDLYIFGGAAFILDNQIAREVTSDVDAFVPNIDHRYMLRDLRQEVAKEQGVSNLWMTINANANLSAMVAKRDAYFTPALEELKTSGLSVYVLKPEVQLARKLLASVSTKQDRGQKDFEDIKKLAKTLDIKDGPGLIAVWDKHKGKMGESGRTLVEMDDKLKASTFIKGFRL